MLPLKKTQLTVLALLFCHIGKSQSISISDLTYLSKASQIKFATLLTQKDFDFDPSVRPSSTETEVSAFSNTKTRERVTLREDVISGKKIYYLFYSQQYFVSLKNQIVKSYSLIKTEETADSFDEYYESSIYKIMLVKFKGIKAYSLLFSSK